MNDMSTSRASASTDQGAPSPAPRRGRGRRPAEEVRREVLDAAGGLLFDAGVGAVTFDRVAAASGASKTTIYKWWPSPGALAAEAYFTRVERALDFEDTGDVRRDVRMQMLAFAELMTAERAGRVIRELIGAAQTDPALQEALVTRYALPRRREAVVTLRRGQERGQIRADAPLEAMVDQLWGACYHRLLLFDEPLDDALVDQLIENVFLGAGVPTGDR